MAGYGIVADADRSSKCAVANLGTAEDRSWDSDEASDVTIVNDEVPATNHVK